MRWIDVVLGSLFGLLLLVGAPGCTSPGDAREEPRVTWAQETPWVEIQQASGYNWSAAVKRMPVEVERIDRVLRNRAVFRREGIGFGHLMLGSGALYPYHSHASPEAYHVVSGEAEWTVDGETRRVGPGTSIYHRPYADHRWVTTSAEPLRVVWAQWVPDGDRSGLVADGVRRRGGSSTGAFFPGERRSRSVLVTKRVAPVESPVPGSFIDEMRRARLEARAAEPMRPVIRTYVDSVEIPWNTELAGIRWRAVLTTPDLEWGHVVISGDGTSGSTRVIPASSAPGLLHVFSGRARLRAAGGSASRVATGASFRFMAGEEIEVEFTDGAEPLRAMWVRWAPAGDLGYWARDYFLVEPMPEPPAEAELSREIRFFTDVDS